MPSKKLSNLDGADQLSCFPGGRLEYSFADRLICGLEPEIGSRLLHSFFSEYILDLRVEGKGGKRRKFNSGLYHKSLLSVKRNVKM
ncbi:hypothetical protein TNIN_14271 [Trichonephila inaurata madagascariensis]|uniref:Uncharacterized protein n=1 Tax=Trichonephila inaurata madagascariensis TaxID=2747483 RepID=A0A8X7C781_9ARAC|nr:hypothetical protein TNIN_14271 [Trichonephila inaurata madagascariensis]